MELMHQQYLSIVLMPIKRFQDLIKWKTDLEEERNKIMKEQQDRIISASKQKRK
jgi:hypothetical protein